MRPVVSLYPKVIVEAQRGWCRGCGTIAVVIGEDCARGFKNRHARCREQGE